MGLAVGPQDGSEFESSHHVRVVSARDDPPSALAHHLGSYYATLWTLPPQRCTRDDARGRKEPASMGECRTMSSSRAALKM